MLGRLDIGAGQRRANAETSTGAWQALPEIAEIVHSNGGLILVDCGVAFPDMDTTPGVDLIIADIDWLAKRADRLARMES